MNALVYDAPRQIVDSGSGATGLKAGQRASASTTLMACGRCFYCRHGDLLACENVDGIGVEVNGALRCTSNFALKRRWIWPLHEKEPKSPSSHDVAEPHEP